MEELALLVAMQRIVGGIEVEDDLFRSLRVSFQEEIDEQAFDRRRVVTNLVITRRFGAAQFQPVQRGLAGQRRTVTPLRLQLASQHREHRVAAQLVVVVQVLITQSNADHALHHHGLDRAFHQLRCARIGEQEANRSVSRIARSVWPSSSAPASEVIAPPSNEATTSRPPTGGNSNNAGLQSVCIGASCGFEKNRGRNTILSDPRPRCHLIR